MAIILVPINIAMFLKFVNYIASNNVTMYWAGLQALPYPVLNLSLAWMGMGYVAQALEHDIMAETIH